MGSKGSRRRKPYRHLPKLPGHVSDEPPAMWSPGFQAGGFTPAGIVQGMWRFAGRGSDGREAEALQSRNEKPHRLQACLFRLLGGRKR